MFDIDFYSFQTSCNVSFIFIKQFFLIMKIKIFAIKKDYYKLLYYFYYICIVNYCYTRIIVNYYIIINFYSITIIEEELTST